MRFESPISQNGTQMIYSFGHLIWSTLEMPAALSGLITYSGGQACSTGSTVWGGRSSDSLLRLNTHVQQAEVENHG